MSELVEKCLSFFFNNRDTIKPRQPINNRPVTFMWMISSEMNTEQDIDKSVKITLLCRCGCADKAKKSLQNPIILSVRAQILWAQFYHVYLSIQYYLTYCKASETSSRNS